MKEFNKELVIKKLEGILEKDYYLKKEDGLYVGEIYLDYRYEGLDSDGIKEVFENENPETYLCEKVSEDEAQAMLYERDSLMDNLRKDFTKEEWSYCSEAIESYIQENVVFYYPENYLFGTKVNVDIVIGVEEEANHEFTLNTFEDEALLDGSIKWLIGQQGHDYKKLEEFINSGKGEMDNKFLRSVIQELENCTTSIGKLSVFTKMTINELIQLQKKIDEEDVVSITIPKSADIGLIDTYNGAGSVLEICLEKDLVIPKEYIYSILPDCTYRYSVGSIYGFDDSFWKEHDVKVNTKA